jgi:hypothetical protein
MRCKRLTRHSSLSSGRSIAFIKARRRSIEEMATITAATLSLSDPASSLPSDAIFRPAVAMRRRETKFS